MGRCARMSLIILYCEANTGPTLFQFSFHLNILLYLESKSRLPILRVFWFSLYLNYFLFSILFFTLFYFQRNGNIVTQKFIIFCDFICSAENYPFLRLPYIKAPNSVFNAKFHVNLIRKNIAKKVRK